MVQDRPTRVIAEEQVFPLGRKPVKDSLHVLEHRNVVASSRVPGKVNGVMLGGVIWCRVIPESIRREKDMHRSVEETHGGTF